jgi:thioesterase domain-containing protein
MLIHPVGGGIFCYLKFAKYLEKFMPVYGIQNSILTLDGKAFDNLQDLAKFYNGKIKEMLPNDEFILGGWSFGGNVAYEMACQLAKLNQNIPKIYFFDSWNFSKLDFTHEILMREAVNQYIPEVIDLAAGYDMRNKQEFFDLLSKRMALVLNHKSDICGTDVVLFKAKNVLSQFQSINCENNHWHKIISDYQLSVISVNSSHDSLFNEKFVKELADKFLENIGLSL